MESLPAPWNRNLSKFAQLFVIRSLRPEWMLEASVRFSNEALYSEDTAIYDQWHSLACQNPIQSLVWAADNSSVLSPLILAIVESNNLDYGIHLQLAAKESGFSGNITYTTLRDFAKNCATCRASK